MFSIVTAQPYPSDYDECLDRVEKEKAEDARPTPAGAVENMDQYDVIFLGYPDWSGTCPMAPHGEFLEEIGIYRRDTEEARPEIQKWVRELDVTK